MNQFSMSFKISLVPKKFALRYRSSDSSKIQRERNICKTLTCVIFNCKKKQNSSAKILTFFVHVRSTVSTTVEVSENR